MPPTSIDGTDITGATIDGTDVTEITVDGDTVFKSEAPIPGTQVSEWLFNENSGTVSFDTRRSFDADFGTNEFVSGSGPGGVVVELNDSDQGGVITGGASDWDHFRDPVGTMMAWVKPDGQNLDSIFTYGYNSSGSGSGFYFHQGAGALRCNTPNRNSSLSLDSNQWNFTVLAMDSSEFLFGVAKEPNYTLVTESLSGAGSQGTVSFDPAIGGHITNKNTRGFDGLMSICAKTDVKMSTSEIQSYIDATKSTF